MQLVLDMSELIRVPRTLLDGNGGFRWSKMVLDDLIAALFILGY